MTFSDVKRKFESLGLQEVAATQWAEHLTRDGRQPTEQEVENFRQQRLVPRKRHPRLVLLTTPEEQFGERPEPNE